MLVVSRALSFGVSFVKTIIERSFVPEVSFEKFSTVARKERPLNNEVFEVVVHFLSALKCYSL